VAVVGVAIVCGVAVAGDEVVGAGLVLVAAADGVPKIRGTLVPVEPLVPVVQLLLLPKIEDVPPATELVPNIEVNPPKIDLGDADLGAPNIGVVLLCTVAVAVAPGRGASQHAHILVAKALFLV